MRPSRSADNFRQAAGCASRRRSPARRSRRPTPSRRAVEHTGVGAPSKTNVETVSPEARAKRASSPDSRRRAPALSRCQPTRWPITLLPSTNSSSAQPPLPNRVAVGVTLAGRPSSGASGQPAPGRRLALIRSKTSCQPPIRRALCGVSTTFLRVGNGLSVERLVGEDVQAGPGDALVPEESITDLSVVLATAVLSK